MQTPPHTHNYDSHLLWKGSTGAGYRAYDRSHQMTTPPAATELALSADPQFGGDPDRTNPEQMLVAAASSCQLLSFLSLAARRSVDVVAYEDQARGCMPRHDPPMRLTRIELAPTITVAAGTDHDLVRQLVQEAHEGCYVARSLRSEVVVDATVVER
jgi:organic hydroperoxide reductase OsmC/OhrA